MKKINSEKGQALILIALAIVGLVAFSALAIDGGRVLSDRRHAQNAADAAALAAALEKIQGGDNTDAENAAMNRADSNGYDDLVASDVIVNIPPVSGQYAGNPQYIQVIIHSYVPTTFARVLGRTEVENTVEAITRVQGSTSSSSFFSGAGMAATKMDPDNQCFLINGSADLTLHDTGIFVNCTGNEALFINGGADVELGANAEVAGCAKNQGGNLSGDGTIVCNAPQQTVDESTFENVPTTLPTPTCSSPGTQSGNTLSQGYFNGNVSMNNDVTLNPGTYCFNGGLNINGSANLHTVGEVRIVLGNGSLNLNGANNTFDKLEVYVNNGDFRVTGSLTANDPDPEDTRFRFFSTGTGDFIVQNGTFSCNNTYLYSYRGEITINSTSVVNIKAPPQGDTFGGLLIHMPWGNTNAFILNGSTEDLLTGTIMVPTSDVTYNGGSGFELHGQVIGYTFKVNGGGHTDIYYDASENYNPADDPTIEITK